MIVQNVERVDKSVSWADRFVWDELVILHSMKLLSSCSGVFEKEGGRTCKPALAELDFCDFARSAPALPPVFPPVLPIVVTCQYISA
jgi:hypothetical protein